MTFQIYDKNEVLKHILEIVNKTNMIDYTMDIRKRLNYGDNMPEVSFIIFVIKIEIKYFLLVGTFRKKSYGFIKT